MKKKSQKLYLKHLIDPSFQGANRLLVLSFGKDDDDIKRKGHASYYLSKVETKDYNVMIDGQNILDGEEVDIHQLLRNKIKTYKTCYWSRRRLHK